MADDLTTADILNQYRSSLPPETLKAYDPTLREAIKWALMERLPPYAAEKLNDVVGMTPLGGAMDVQEGVSGLKGAWDKFNNGELIPGLSGIPGNVAQTAVGAAGIVGGAALYSRIAKALAARGARAAEAKAMEAARDRASHPPQIAQGYTPPAPRDPSFDTSDIIGPWGAHGLPDNVAPPRWITDRRMARERLQTRAGIPQSQTRNELGQFVGKEEEMRRLREALEAPLRARQAQERLGHMAPPGPMQNRPGLEDVVRALRGAQGENAALRGTVDEYGRSIEGLQEQQRRQLWHLFRSREPWGPSGS